MDDQQRQTAFFAKTFSRPSVQVFPSTQNAINHQLIRRLASQFSNTLPGAGSAPGSTVLFGSVTPCFRRGARHTGAVAKPWKPLLFSVATMVAGGLIVVALTGLRPPKRSPIAH